MAKKLRRDRAIYIAPDIWGQLDDNGVPIVIDEQRDNRPIDPRNVNDKILIYERQVKEWFFQPATNLVRYRNKNKGFIVLMICLSYIEGVEQYKRGEHSNNRSRQFFIDSMNRIYPNRFRNDQLGDLYAEARCALFHNGMVRGKIIINNGFTHPLEFESMDILISPSKFLEDLKQDFDRFIHELRTNPESSGRFDRMYSNLDIVDRNH